LSLAELKEAAHIAAVDTGGVMLHVTLLCA
jgi:hypothetical protein